jgi:ribosomal protein S18 acetylase RimI-like enzyme
LLLQKVNIQSLERIQQIGRTTFEETFSPFNTAENMLSYLENGFSTEKLTKEINESNSEFYIVSENDTLIGYLKVNIGAAQTEFNTANSLEIERIYVLKAYHGKKVGQLLFEKAEDLAQRKQVDFIWLGVWEKNERAIHFYQKNGFEIIDQHIFKLGTDLQTDFIMRKKLI